MSHISCPTSSFNSLFLVLNLETCLPKRYTIRVTRYVARLWHGEYYDIVSACHLYGKSGNSEKNSNRTVHLGEIISGKRVIPSDVVPISRLYRNDRNLWKRRILIFGRIQPHPRRVLLLFKLFLVLTGRLTNNIIIIILKLILILIISL